MVYWILAGFWKQILNHKIRLVSNQRRLLEDLSSNVLFKFYEKILKKAGIYL